MLTQSIEIEVDILKSRLENLERNFQWLQENWVGWTKDTKDIGQKLMVALVDKVVQ